MIFSVQVRVMPLKDLLDPQGKAVMGSLQNLGIPSISNVRIGKNILLQIESNSKEEAMEIDWVTVDEEEDDAVAAAVSAAAAQAGIDADYQYQGGNGGGGGSIVTHRQGNAPF